jgi:hypothetical protein
MQLQLSKFDPSTINDGDIVCVVGKRNTGKSFIVRDILYHKRHIPFGIVFSKTERTNNFYKKFVPDAFIYHALDEKILKQILERQIRRVEKHGLKKASMFLVLDDLLFDKSVPRMETFREIFFNGRHAGITVIITTQFVTLLPPAIRANCDYVVACYEDAFNTLKSLHEMFFGIFQRFQAFRNVFEACTQNYETLVLDRTKRAMQSRDLETKLFWYKAKERTNFKVGGNAYWQFHKLNYEPHKGEGEEESFVIKNRRR